MTGEVEFNGDVTVNGGVLVNGEVEVKEILSVSGKIQGKYGLDKSLNQDLRENGIDDCNCCTCCDEGQVKSKGLVANGERKNDEFDGSDVFVNSGNADVDIVGDSAGDSVKVDLVENKGTSNMMELKELAEPVVHGENGVCSVGKLVVGKEECMVLEGEFMNRENGGPAIEGSKVSDGNDVVLEVNGECVADDVEIENEGEIALGSKVLNKDSGSIVESNVTAENGVGELHVENKLSEVVVSQSNVVIGDGNILPEISGVGESVCNFENDKGEIKGAAPESNVAVEKKDCDVDEKVDKREIEAGNSGTYPGENGYPHNEKHVSSDAVIVEASEIESVVVEMVESKTTTGGRENSVDDCSCCMCCVEGRVKSNSLVVNGEGKKDKSDGSYVPVDCGNADIDSKSEVPVATPSESAVHENSVDDCNCCMCWVEGRVKSNSLVVNGKGKNNGFDGSYVSVTGCNANVDSKSEVPSTTRSESTVHKEGDPNLKSMIIESTRSEPCMTDNKNNNELVENEDSEFGVDVAVKDTAVSEPCDNGVLENENGELAVDVAVKESTKSDPYSSDSKNDNGVVENKNSQLGVDVAVKESGESEMSFTEDLNMVRENSLTKLTQFSSNRPTEDLGSHSGQIAKATSNPEVGEPCEVTLDGPSFNGKKDDLPSQPSLDTVCEIKAVTESIGTNQILDVQVDCCGTGDSVDGGKGVAENGEYHPIKKINSSSWADVCSSDDENDEPATEMEGISGEEEQKVVVSHCAAAVPASTKEACSATAKTRSSSSLTDVRSLTEICFGSLSPEEVFSTPSEDNGVGSGAPEAVSNSASIESLTVDVPHTNEEPPMKVQNVAICDNDGGQVGDQVVASMDKRDEQPIDGGSDERPIDQEAKAADVLPCDETVSPEVHNIEASEGTNASSGTEKKRLFNFLVRVPRQDDGNLKEQINNAHSLVAQKTEIRDAIRTEMQDQKAACKKAKNNLEAARSEERASWDLVNKKRNEIDFLQLLINKAKDSVSIDDIREKINNLNRMIQIGGISLKEEKQILNEIKSLDKRLHEHRASTVSLKDEPKQDVDQREQNEERMKCLRKEIEPLKENARKAKAAVAVARQKHSDENEKLRQLQARFQDADEVRQKAYMQLQSLRSQSYEKNKNFFRYKNELKEYNELKSKGDLQGLSQLCLQRAEEFMKSWNENDQFRDEYIKANAQNTLRRLRTSDGRSLGPDEEPPVLPVSANEKGAREIAVPAHPNQDRDIVPAADKLPAKPKEHKKQSAKTKNLAKSIPQVGVTVSGRDEIDEVVEEPKRSKEEEELIRKAEQLRKEEEEARLREQRRLEEKIKAKEALERKKRTAEKAQARAALKVQKEAEQKEKEREKRAKKKERKKLAAGASPTDANKEGESAPPLEAPVETPVEPETREEPVTNPKKPKRPSHFVKVTKVQSIPPPLRNRGKRKMQPWMWVLLVAVLILALSVIGNGRFLF